MKKFNVVINGEEVEMLFNSEEEAERFIKERNKMFEAWLSSDEVKVESLDFDYYELR